MTKEVTFVGAKPFERAARKLFTKEQRKGLMLRLGDNPSVGDVIPKSGGARKVRHFGIRGQSRVIYYYPLGHGMIWLLTAYAKGQKADLTRDEIKEFNGIIATIKEGMKNG